MSADFVRIASCGQSLYATKADGSLYVSLKGGDGPFTSISASAPGMKIACDRLHLYSLSSGTLYHHLTDIDGTLSGAAAWSVVGTVPSGTDEIASGNGNIYAMVYSGGVGTVWTSQLNEAISPKGYVQGSTSSWLQQATGLGANRVTGSGSRAWFSAWTDVGGNPHTKRNRAFIADPDDTLYFNDRILDGANWWTTFPKGNGVDILQISAEDSNTLYALATTLATNGNFKRIIRYSFHETNCHDGLDNDADGLRDAQDPRCRSSLANEWCSTRSSGSYCIDRIEDTDGYHQALVTCRSGGEQALLEPGVCVRGSSSNNDFLAPARAINESSTGGRYCSVIHSDGGWGFAWDGDDPCASLLRGRLGSFIARAGQYSKVGVNNVLAKCNNGSYVPHEGIGTVPLSDAKNSVGNTTNRCVFTVSPKTLGIFNAPFPKLTWTTTYGRGYGAGGHVFDHAPKCQAGDPGCPCYGPYSSVNCPIDLAPFGNGQTTTSSYIDNLGKPVTGSPADQLAYDFSMAEGVPLRSLGNGVVVDSRDFDMSPLAYSTVDRDTFGTPYIGEIYIRYDVGTEYRYQESFVAYYAHVGLRTVVTGQTVEAGQLIGYVGTTGPSSAPHLHFGIIRLTNTNGQRTGTQGEAFGYKVPFNTVSYGMGYRAESMAGAVDPYGWRAPIDGSAESQDPMAHRWAQALSSFDNVRGIGAWSPNLWYSSEETPPYPTP